ncbi:MAG TPA: glycerate kinase, partial [Chitinophagaceae bacterium]|nr:glycerate kinase [Chitinophagaceae bacterium]
MKILIAPNAFKNSLDAAAVAAAINTGLQQSRLDCVCKEFPIGDGGDGTASLLIQRLKGTIETTEAHDPLGRKIISSFGLIEKGTTAVIEMADASGLRLLQPHEYNPMKATTYGTGELIKAALDKNVTKMILCIGGSATVDGAAGIMLALGVRLKDDAGNDLQNIPSSLIHLAAIDITDMDKRILNVELIVLCDVENELAGEQGAATVFGPQKGASPDDIKQLDAGLAQLSKVVLSKTGKDMSSVKHGGAAGGVAAGLYAVFNATLENGIEYFLSITRFDEALQNADLVITGEGSIDAQTLQGKGPYGVAKMAKERSVPVIGMAGRVPLKTDTALQKYFDILLPISNEVMDITTAL